MAKIARNFHSDRQIRQFSLSHTTLQLQAYRYREEVATYSQERNGCVHVHCVNESQKPTAHHRRATVRSVETARLKVEAQEAKCLTSRLRGGPSNALRIPCPTILQTARHSHKHRISNTQVLMPMLEDWNERVSPSKEKKLRWHGISRSNPLPPRHIKHFANQLHH